TGHGAGACREAPPPCPPPSRGRETIDKIRGLPLLQTAALSDPEFRRYYLGQGVSVVGTWMQSVAISWLVLDLSHNSALALALSGACQYGPVLLVGPFAGALVDRTVHRDLLLITQVVSTLGATALA